MLISVACEEDDEGYDATEAIEVGGGMDLGCFGRGGLEIVLQWAGEKPETVNFAIAYQRGEDMQSIDVDKAQQMLWHFHLVLLAFDYSARGFLFMGKDRTLIDELEIHV